MSNSFLKDLLAVLKSRGTVIICGILTSVITARYLGPEGNGVLATLTVFPALFMTVGSLGIRQSTAYFIGKKKYEDSDVFSSVITVWIFTSFICTIACFVILKYFTKGNYSNNLIFLALLPIPFSLFTTYSSGLFLGKNRIKEFNTVNWIPNVVKLIAYVLLIILIPWSVYGALTGIVAGYFLLTFIVWRQVGKMIKIAWNYNIVIIKEMLGLGLVYALSLLIINLNYKFDVALLEHYSTNYEVGIYTKGVSIVEHLWDVPTLLGTIVFARSATATDAKGFSYKVCLLLRICFVIILFTSIVFYFLSEIIMVTMYGSQFKGSASVQKLLLPGILLLTIFKVLNMDLAGKGKPWVAVISMLPALVINVILNWLWDQKYGANGAALASTVSYSASAFIFLFMYSRSVDIPVKEIFKFSLRDFDIITNYIKNLKAKKLNKKRVHEGI